MPFPGRPVINVRPVPRYQPRPNNPMTGMDGMTNTRPDIPAGRPDRWGNSTPWRENIPKRPNDIPSSSTGGEIVPANNPGPGGITLPNNNSSNTTPRNNHSWGNRDNYPDRPIETWNLRPDIGNGRPNRIPTIDVTPNPINRPNNGIDWGAVVQDSLKEVWENNFGNQNQRQTEEFLHDFYPPQFQAEELEAERLRQMATNWMNNNNPGSGGNAGSSPVSYDRWLEATNFVDQTLYNNSTTGDQGSRRESAPSSRMFPPVFVPANFKVVATTTTGDVFVGFGDPPTFIENQGFTTTLKLVSPDGTETPIWRNYPVVTGGYQIGIQRVGGANPIESFASTNKNTLTYKVRPAEPIISPAPHPWFTYQYDVSQDEDEMNCRNNCEAARVIRSLQRTITVDSVTISKIPTGNMVQVPTVETHRVFALPGTEAAIKRQFNLMTDIRKRLAQTFNQSRMSKVLAKLNQLMQVTDFVLNLHNALMLTEDIVQTFFQPIFGAVDTIVSVLDDTPFIGNLFDLEEKSLNSAEIFSSKFEDAMKAIFGVQGWAEVKAKWAAFNNIVRGAAMQIQAVRDINDSQKELQEMTASKLGKLHNKMVNAGVIFDSSMWEENVKARQTWINKFYKLEELADDNPVTNAASYVSSWGQQYLDIKEEKKELAESRKKYQEDLQKDLQTLTNKKIDTVNDSAGSTYERSDGKAPETNND